MDLNAYASTIGIQTDDNHVSNNHKMWLQISSDYFMAALVIKNGIVETSAPILKYMEGWTVDRVKEYCREKHWEVICV